MKKNRLFIVLSASFLLLLGAGLIYQQIITSPPLAKYRFFAMDTLCLLKVDKNHSDILPQMENEIRRMENKYSRYRDDSLIWELNMSGSVEDETLAMLLRSYFKESEIIRRYFRPEMGVLMDLWDFPGGGKIPKRQTLQQALDVLSREHVHVRGNTVSLAQGLSLDLGGLFKGWMLDRLMEMALKRGVRYAVINLGGDVALFSKRPRLWKIGVRNPRGDGVSTWIEKKGSLLFVVTSGDYERFFMKENTRYHHILSPLTGYPARDVQSVTVIDSSGLRADILSTAYFAGAQDKETFFEAEDPRTSILMIYQDGQRTMWNLEEEKNERGFIFYSSSP
jgi:thiamine biosynthesis lipoprotein